MLIACVAVERASADDYHREDLRIPMAAAGSSGLEAMLVRPAGTRRYPLALISHGAPRDADERPAMSPYRLYFEAVEFARRGFAALVVMRRGYGTSGGAYAEDSGPCGRRDYLLAAKASADDLRAAIEAVQGRLDVSTDGMIAVGVSAGGFASLALSADPPSGLAAVISFAGGRGSRGDNDVCDEAALISAFKAFGQKSRIPTLWIYARNDKFFWPDLAHRLNAAFTGAGGTARFIDAPASGDDGHFLFSEAIPVWTPTVDGFLREQNLGSRDILALPSPPHCHHPHNSARTASGSLRSFWLPARTRPLRYRQMEALPGVAVSDRQARPAMQPWPDVSNTNRTARYMRSTMTLPEAGTRDRANRPGYDRSRYDLLGLPFGRRDDEAVEFVAYLDLAGKPRIRPHVEAEIEHVLFHRSWSADFLAPGFVDIHMTCRAGAGPAAFGFDAGNGVADRCFHHRCAVLNVDGAGFAGMVGKVDLGHDARAAGKEVRAVL